VIEPFWSSPTMRGEGLLFVQDEPGAPPRASLLFEPEEILALTSATGLIAYEAGRDFEADRAARSVRLPAGSRLPFLTRAELYPPWSESDPHQKPRAGNTGTGLLFGEGDFFHRRQAAVTYTHASGAWSGPVPCFAGGQLPAFSAKLRAGRAVKIAVSGDSISVGGNASGFMGVPPGQPACLELVADGLRRSTGAAVELRNFAQGGWCADDGLLDAERVAREAADLTVIAYGMNDNQDRDPARFAANVRGIMAAVRRAHPPAEFLLVAPTIGNLEWAKLDRATFLAQRDALAGLVGPGAALADLTSVWAALLGRKRWLDLGANGVNHPNDWGHRICAQVILAVLVGEEKRGKG
jgi:acyl-CoA thioesterase-1